MIHKKSLPLHRFSRENNLKESKKQLLQAPAKSNKDSLAQLVEHNTFNVGVLGSSPRRITKTPYKMRKIAENQTFSAIFIFGKTPKIGISEHSAV